MMAQRKGTKTVVPDELLIRLKEETGKPLEEIEEAWSEQRTERQKSVKCLLKENVTNAARFFEKTVDEHHDKVFIVYGGAHEEDIPSGSTCLECCTRVLTYKHVDYASNSVAAWAVKLQGRKDTECSAGKGDECSVKCSECTCRARVAAMLMLSSPEYIIILLGLLKAGMTVALLHPQLRGSLLRKAVGEADPQLLICDDLTVASLRHAWLEECCGKPGKTVHSTQKEKEYKGSYPCPVFICGAVRPKEDVGEHSLVPHVHRHIKDRLSEEEVAHYQQHMEASSTTEEHRCQPKGFPLVLKERLYNAVGLALNSEGGDQHREHQGEVDALTHQGELGRPCVCLYTADFDGHMCAAYLSHNRFISAGLVWKQAVPLSSSDRLLLGVHLSHEVGVHALASAIACGGALLLRHKCSILSLWEDLKALDASVLWHTGMMWARLLRSHERFHGGEHMQRLGSWSGHPRLRASVGTGLLRELWPVVKHSFNIPCILEFHSLPILQTAHVLYNAWGMTGACSFIPNAAWDRMPFERLVEFNEKTDEVERDKASKRGKEASRCPRTLIQRGELVSHVSHGHNLILFTRKEKTEQFLYKDLFEEGDVWCRSGEIMERDAAGFLYFCRCAGFGFRIDGEAAPLADVAALLKRHAGVLGARVEGMRVFADSDKAAANSMEEKVKAGQKGWPKTAVELFQAGECHRKLKCLVACVHAKLEACKITDGDGIDQPQSCGDLDLDSSLLVIGEEEAECKRKEGSEGEVTLVSVQTFLRKLRSCLDHDVHLAIRPTVLMLCFAECSSASDRRSSIGSTCGSCSSRHETECKCSCGCCWECEGCSAHRKSVQGLCDLIDGQGCCTAGSKCKEGCKRRCFLFYADTNGDAFTPLRKDNFQDFVRESYSQFGL
ncbi:uncharacterized protein LOC34623562 [Cyclospora cayetanensis]|uniref:Very-long-chain acyl-related protein n=2 Tax=Cyclospora cayetanensis TaxID=88456 RepID=A0A1D3D355_9EIME|nr:uncharacterized protein LOC34623562 [Cyclospora cayetanensis]OEH77877.1 very-long-chain acyl-related protein [Cyclospora cayetanensis]